MISDNAKLAQRIVLEEWRPYMTPTKYKSRRSTINDGIVSAGEMWELMCSEVNGLQRSSDNKREDYVNLDDAKFASINQRAMNKEKGTVQSSYRIGNLTHKHGALLVMLANTILNEAYYLCIPYDVYMGSDFLEISAHPELGIPTDKWLRYAVPGVTALCS